MKTRNKPAARRKNAKGFSLLELTLVLAIIGVLMAVAAYNVVGAGARAKAKATRASMETIKSTLNQYQLEHSSYPQTLQVLVTGKFLEDKGLKDGWGRAFYYAVPGRNNQPFDLLSLGEDNQAGTPDDIDVWTMSK